MKMGFARKDISPTQLLKAGHTGKSSGSDVVPLAGYLLDRRCQGIHDRLYARALVFKGNAGLTAILQLDLLNLDHITLEKIHKGLAALGLEKKQLLVCAAHTHSGFGGIFDTSRGINQELLPLLGAFDPHLLDLVVTQSLTCIAEAAASCEETMVRINRGTIDSLGANRHDPDLPADKDFFAMELYRIDRKKVLLYNLSCHPTVMNGENLLLSADFPGAVAARLEDVPEGYDMVVFINGAAGDMSTRFTREESSFTECSRFALLIEETLRALKNGVFLPLEKVQLEYHTILLDRAEIPGLETAEVNLAAALQNLDMAKSHDNPQKIRKAESFVEGAKINLIKAQYAAPVKRRKTTKAAAKVSARVRKPAAVLSEIPVETGILRINSTTAVCPPLELFSTLALPLKKEKSVEIFGYANALLGYLADREAYDNMDYEALSSDFKRGEGERYIELMAALL
ncbi:hypothetical protein AGMMS50230_06830 [Spirochaetia bacterium]|nr:hypothetical protein AGMMS50230_06830 [Spirochaetia bacterium]